jgi:ketosteroid isomerase-like protein
MSPPNVEIASGIYEAWNRGDIDALVGMFDEKAQVRPALSAFMNSTVYLGHDGVRDWFADTYEPWADLRVEPVRFIEAGDRVVVVVVCLRARVPGGRVTLDSEIAHVVMIREGRVVGLDGYDEPGAALSAVGAAE